jgi:hypothetical protein
VHQQLEKEGQDLDTYAYVSHPYLRFSSSSSANQSSVVRVSLALAILTIVDLDCESASSSSSSKVYMNQRPSGDKAQAPNREKKRGRERETRIQRTGFIGFYSVLSPDSTFFHPAPNSFHLGYIWMSENKIRLTKRS